IQSLHGTYPPLSLASFPPRRSSDVCGGGGGGGAATGDGDGSAGTIDVVSSSPLRMARARSMRFTRCCATLSSFCACSRASDASRSDEHTSELQSRENLVCRLLLEKK